ncbi:9917_t:CDS:2 [Paraglomus brasilianum]|uniref:9917_t:CDS:1 n=1 Tax=Paraglomus brasilianum TaxID=144538 RepID=A0A9N8VZY4_9GLOM|nr:9917_t:CDS:2 [Paraglomus brasilianum]
MSEISEIVIIYPNHQHKCKRQTVMFQGFIDSDTKKDWDSSQSSTEKPPPWKKLLWVKQDYPDDYVDSTFLHELRKNVNVRAYDYWEVVMESGVISQHISSIIIFVAVFIYLYFDMLSAEKLIATGTILTAIGYIIWALSIRKTDPSYEYKQKKTAKGAVLFFATLLGLSPILKTLTKDTSSDTIWALTVILFLTNMLFHDYGSGNRTNIRFPGSVSVNAAIFASVLLASRLPSNLHVFGLMSFAVEWFALFPIFRRYTRVMSKNHESAGSGEVEHNTPD